MHTPGLIDTLARLTSSCKCAGMLPAKWKILHSFRLTTKILIHSRFSKKPLCTHYLSNLLHGLLILMALLLLSVAERGEVRFLI